LDLTLTGSIDRDIKWLELGICGGQSGPGQLLWFWSPYPDDQRIELRVTGFTLPAPRNNLPGELHVQTAAEGDDIAVLPDCRIDITDAQPDSPSGMTGYLYRGRGECTPTATLSASEFSFMSIAPDPQ
jgi:hypothetical protein